MAAAQTHAPDVCVSDTQDTVASQLATHPWLAGAHVDPADTGVLLVLNPEGIQALRQHGRQALLDQVQAYLAEHAVVPSQDLSRKIWRVRDAVPTDLSPHALDALLKAARPNHVTPIAEHAQDDTWTLTLHLPPDLIHFDGHFPRAPVLPGVLQVGWALALAAPRLGTSMHCREMEALKFQQLLRPCDQIELTLRFDTTRSKLHFAYRLDGAHASSGRLCVARTND
jgi:3-hydroxymyristoyl/3-hydroxydecanoyl-(acyl carrier protein) dehydratase